MGFMVAPKRKAEAQERFHAFMQTTKCELQTALPFAMDPVVYDFQINEKGTFADRLTGSESLMPRGYYALVAPQLIRIDRRNLSTLRRAELDKFAAACRTRPELSGMVQELFEHLLPRGHGESAGTRSLDELLSENGFDRELHE